jgi:hypothetical protein
MSRSSNTASTSSTHRRLEERPAQDRAELARLVVAQLHRRRLVSIGVAAVDNAAPTVMDDENDVAVVASRHLVAATDSWQIVDDESRLLSGSIRLSSCATGSPSMTNHARCSDTSHGLLSGDGR